MNKPCFCRNFFLTDLRHKRLKNTIDLLLFCGEHFYGFSESEYEVGTFTRGTALGERQAGLSKVSSIRSAPGGRPRIKTFGRDTKK